MRYIAGIFKSLCKNLGLVYDDTSKSWLDQSPQMRPMTCGILYTSIGATIGGKSLERDFNVFSNGDEKPWDNFNLDVLKTLPVARFKVAFVKISTRTGEIMIRVTLCDCADDESTDKVSMYIVIGKHKDFAKKENITKTEINRALIVVRQVLKTDTKVIVL